MCTVMCVFKLNAIIQNLKLTSGTVTDKLK